MTQFAVSALIARRREIMGEKAYLEKEIGRCDEATAHIDATIRLFDPEFDFSRIKPRRHLNEDEFFQPGEIPVLALEVLRDAGQSLPTNAVTEAILPEPAARWRSTAARTASVVSDGTTAGTVPPARPSYG